MAKVTREVSDRTPAGRAVKSVFIVFNLVMPFLIFHACSGSLNRHDTVEPGWVLGSGIVFVFLLITWLAGAVILGLMTILTRRRKLIEVDEPDC